MVRSGGTKNVSRRRALTGAAAAMPALAGMPLPAWAAPRHWQRPLVLVELNGGNDGLNTVVPWRDPLYRRARPTLGLGDDRLIPISEELAFNQALAPLLPAWQAGELAVVLGVGYPQPNRSHFRSIEIWDTASAADEVLDAGWVAQLMSDWPPRTDAPADAIAIGRGAGPLQGGSARVLTLDRPDQALAQAQRLRAVSGAGGNPALAHVLQVRQTIRAAAADLLARTEAVEIPAGFPTTRLGRQLEMVAAMLLGGVRAPAFKVSHGSFDTHARQDGPHTQLVTQLAEGLAAFRTAMVAAGLWDQVLVMTYAEFGRRVSENGSAGTDHGTAAPHFVLGGQIAGGFHGRQPPLNDLDGGDLRHAVDFRDMYAAVARHWWGLADAFPAHRPLPLIAG